MTFFNLSIPYFTQINNIEHKSVLVHMPKYPLTSSQVTNNYVTKTTNDETWGSASSYTTVTYHELYVKFIRWRPSITSLFPADHNSGNVYRLVEKK